MAFSTNGTSGGNSLSSEINVTPLIDVLLVMLIIFMVIVPVMPRGLGAVLPSPRTDSSDEVAIRPVLVEIQQAEVKQGAAEQRGAEQGGADVRYLVDGQSLRKSDVGPRLEEILARRSVRSVLLKGDSGLDYGVISGVIDAGQAAGAESVGLITPRDHFGD